MEYSGGGGSGVGLRGRSKPPGRGGWTRGVSGGVGGGGGGGGFSD